MQAGRHKKTNFITKQMQLYHRKLFTFLVLQFFVFQTKSQEVRITDVIIIGTKHSPNPVYNSDSLMKAVLHLKPDLLLLEQDSTSYIFKSGVFKPLPGWSLYLRRISGWSKKDVEGNMIFRYHREFPQIIIKPFDVAYNGAEREKYIDEHLQLEKDFSVAMYDAYDRREMSDYRATVHLERDQYLSFLLQQLRNGMLKDFNTDSTTQVIRQLETLDYVHFKALVDSVPSLKRFSSRVYKDLQLAEHRNEVMVQQILRYINEYRGKRIVVINGLLHRYYQLDKLAPKREQFNFRILDINGEEMTFSP